MCHLISTCALTPGVCQVCKRKYQEHAPAFLRGMGFPEEVCIGMDMTAHLNLATLRLDSTSSKLGAHRDPASPMPALIGGATTHVLGEGDTWQATDPSWQATDPSKRNLQHPTLFELSSRRRRRRSSSLRRRRSSNLPAAGCLPELRATMAHNAVACFFSSSPDLFKRDQFFSAIQAEVMGAKAELTWHTHEEKISSCAAINELRGIGPDGRGRKRPEDPIKLKEFEAGRACSVCNNWWKPGFEGVCVGKLTLRHQTRIAQPNYCGECAAKGRAGGPKGRDTGLLQQFALRGGGVRALRRIRSQLAKTGVGFAGD